MNKYILNTCIASLFYASLHAQFLNKGELYIASETEVSVYEDSFLNSDALISNNGDLFLFKNVLNNGSIGFDNNMSNGTIYFVGEEKQTINGEGETNLFNVEFNNPSQDFAFVLEKELNIYGTSFFQDGVILEDLNGILTFRNGSSYEGYSDNSYANNKARKIGENEFLFPVGAYKEDVFVARPAGISAPDEETCQFYVAFNWENSDVNYSGDQKEITVGLVDMNEYWVINRESGSSEVAVTLTWNSVTTPGFLANYPENIIIVRWDGSKWIDEGGEVNESENSITATVSEYGVFTLARKNLNLDEDSGIDFDASGSFSPNDDGMNDVFQIPGLAEKYPNFIMKIYNRYGNIVYDYSNNGKTNPMWWDGSANGKIGGDGGKVPTATYWYIVDFNDGKTKPYQSWVYLSK